MAQSATGGAHESESSPEAGNTDDAVHPHPPSTLLLLVRHAVTEQTGPILSGRLPGIELSAPGREQAAAVAMRLSRLPVAAVYASPIERTTRTAESIADHHNLPVQALPGVIEADYGEWTGGRIDELSRTEQWKAVQRTPSRARFPGGESLREMQARTVAALEMVVAQHACETVVVVSHADPINAAVAHFCGMHLDLFQRLHVSPASLTALRFGDDPSSGALLLTCNSTGGIDELLTGRPRDAASQDKAPAAEDSDVGGGRG